METINIKELEDEFKNGVSNTGNDFLKMQTVVDNDIKYIKISEYLGMKITAFPDKVNTFRPNFKVEVIKGLNKGSFYIISLSKPTYEFLSKQIGTDFTKYIGTILTTEIKQKGKFKGIDYSVYEPLTV